MKKKELLEMVMKSLKSEKDKWKTVGEGVIVNKYENKKKGIIIFMALFSFKIFYRGKTLKFGPIAMFKIDFLLPSNPNPDMSQFDIINWHENSFFDII